MHVLTKYVAIAKVSLLFRVSNPIRAFSGIYGTLIPTVYFYYLWHSVLLTSKTTQDYTFAKLITYSALLICLRYLINSANAARDVAHQVKYGDLATLLLKPLHINSYEFIHIMAENSVKAIPSIMLFILAAIALPKVFLAPVTTVGFTVALLFGIFINYLFFRLIGTIAFWSVENEGFTDIIKFLGNVLSGGFFPLDFFGHTTQTVLKFLPFRYTSYVPASIYLGTITGKNLLLELGIQLGWVVLLLLLLRIFWQKGIKRYDSVGN